MKRYLKRRESVLFYCYGLNVFDTSYPEMIAGETQEEIGEIGKLIVKMAGLFVVLILLVFGGVREVIRY